MNILRWVFINAVFAFLLVYGIYFDSVGSLRVGLFIAWLSIIISILCAFSADDFIEAFYRQKDEVPKYPVKKEVSIFFDLAITVLLIYNGMWIVGSAYFIHICAQCYIFMKAEDYKKEVESNG